MSKKLISINESAEDISLLSEKEFDRIASQEMVDVIVSAGKHNIHAKEGTILKVHGLVAAQLVDGRKATLK